MGVSTRSMALEDVPALLERDARTIMLADLEGALLARMTEAEMHAVQRYFQLAHTSIWVTNADVLNGGDAEKCLIFGLAKAVMTEQPSFHLCSLDLSISSQQTDFSNSIELLLEVEDAFHHDPSGDLDTELVEKDGVVYISRYMADDVENANLEKTLFDIKPTVTSLVESANSTYSLAFEKVGRVDSFYFKEEGLKALGEDEVLIDVEAAALDALVCHPLHTCSFLQC